MRELSFASMEDNSTEYGGVCSPWGALGAATALAFLALAGTLVGIGIALGCALEHGTNIPWDAQSGINL